MSLFDQVQVLQFTVCVNLHLASELLSLICALDHAGASDLDWPTGYMRRVCNAGDELRKWKHNKWVWRSNGTVQHEGCAAEVRLCLGVLRCGTCQRLTRPRTQLASRKQQIKNGCQQRTCRIDAAGS